MLATRATEDVNLDEPTFRRIEDLQSVGINMSDIKKLQDAGFSTVGSVLQSSSRDLVAIKGLSEGNGYICLCSVS